MPIEREEILCRLRTEISKGRMIVGAGAGAGISAKFIEAGHADMIVIYNSGKFRMAGRGSLAGLMPFGDANEIVVEMGDEILPIVKHTPVMAGVCGTDPFRRMDVFLKQLKAQGFSGIQNFPTVGLIDGMLRANLEETGMGYGIEVKMIKMAHQIGLFTCPYVFCGKDAEDMALVGADLLVAHMGLTTKGSIGAQTVMTLDDAVKRVQMIADAAHAVNPDIIVLCHGGPIADEEDVRYVISRTKGVHGFFGASSIERFACESSIKQQTLSFKNIILIEEGKL